MLASQSSKASSPAQPEQPQDADPYGVLDPSYTDPRDAHDRRIHVLGPGAVGLFVAHQLSALREPPPVTLLLHKAELMQRWHDVGGKLSLTRHGVTEARTNIDAQLVSSLPRAPAPDGAAIRHLVVAVKAHHLVQALGRVQHLLRPDSTLVFLQNGLGVVDEVNAKLFPDPAARPRYILGSVSHGLYKDGEFAVTHRSVGAITLSVQPTMSAAEWERPLAEGGGGDISAWPPSSRHAMRTLTRAPMLRAAGVAPHAALQASLRKLAGNAVVNPLTALFDCRNGELLNNAAATRLMNLILAEVSLVLRSMPEAKHVPAADEAFGAAALYGYVQGLCEITADNESSMLQDIRAGRQTEIDYINGWVVRKGEELGIRCVVNFAVEQMVKAKSIVAWNHREGLLPLEMPRAHGAMERAEEGRAAARGRIGPGAEDEDSSRTNM